MSNKFGELFSFTTWGESHGEAIGCVVDGCPSLLELDESDIQKSQAFDLVAALRKDRTYHPRTEITPASAAQMKGQAGLCIVS